MQRTRAFMVSCLLTFTARDTVANDAPEEVVVTAQRRAQALDDVPISIKVVDAALLRATGARDISAVAEFAPNVSIDGIVTQSPSSTATSIYIRGIGQSDFLQTTDPGVGMFVDGVYIARAVGSLLDVVDVERVEILRGPQGTLFGRNTIGGAVSVTSRAPAAKRGLELRATLGSDQRFDGYARLDAPIGAHVRTKLTIASFDQDGYIERPGSGDALGNRHRRAAHAQLVFEPNTDFRLTFGADATHVNENAAATTLRRVVQVCPSGVVNAYGGCNANATPSVPVNTSYLFNNLPPFNTAGGGAGVGVSIYDDRYAPDNVYLNHGTSREASELDIRGASLTLDWNLPAFELRSLSAWRTFEGFFCRDTDASNYSVFEPGSAVDQRQISQEVQLLGATGDQRFQWLAGTYWFDERGDDDSKVHGPVLDLQSGGTDIINRSAAVFGQLTWRWSPLLSFIAGARYTEEKKFYTPTQFIISSTTGVPPPGLVVVPAKEYSLEFSRPTWRAVIEARPGDDLLLYASWSTGFKSGGFVQRNSVPAPALPTFKPEDVDVVELGAKASVFDGRAQIRGAVFSSDYRGMQIRVVDPMTFAPVTKNAGDSRIRGAELEFHALASSRVAFDGGIGYLHGRYLNLDPAAKGLTFDSRLTDSPAWSANLAVDVTFTPSLSAHLAWTHRSTEFNDAENTPELRQPPVNLLNLSATWHCASCKGHAWSATFGARNLADERYLVSGFAFNMVSASYARPREWFLSAGLDL